jgi:hypothetical protein
MMLLTLINTCLKPGVNESEQHRPGKTTCLALPTEPTNENWKIINGKSRLLDADRSFVT